MNRISELMMLSVMVAATACGGGGDGNGKGGGSASLALGANASVPMTCQTCLSTSTSNECDNRGEVCADDPDCVALNKCINNCANINAACIQSCGDAASANAITEWTDWTNCACGTCATQCNQTFCNIGGTGSGSSGGSCLADNEACSTTEACCTFCASDGNCGCIPTNNGGCQSNADCCSGYCGNDGYCD